MAISNVMPVTKYDVTTLIFDWDGTLVDSAHLGLLAFQKTFAELGYVFPIDIYESSYSPNWYTTYRALNLPEHLWKRADELWLQHYGEETAELIVDVGETLTTLHTAGYCLGVVTSGSESRVTRELSVSVLNGLLDAVICNEHITNKKPHPEGLELALDRLNCKPHETAYVGDAPEDIEMGKRSNVLTVGVRSNYPSSSRLLAAEPDIYIESIAELTKHFTGGESPKSKVQCPKSNVQSPKSKVESHWSVTAED
jgi:HAD superfamily hydrolase (TIGR01549 family)